MPARSSLRNPWDLPLLESLEALRDAGDGPFALQLAYDKTIRADGGKALAATERLAEVHALEVVNSLDPKALKAVLKSKHLTELRSLSLASNYVHDTGTKALAKWEGLARIEHLCLSGIGLSATGAKALITSPLTSALKTLDLRSNNLQASFVKALVAAPLATQLEVVELAGNPLKDAGVKALAGSPLVRQPVVKLSNVELGKGGLTALLKSEFLEGVHTLELSANHGLGDAGLAVLAKLPIPSSLRVLDIAGTGMGDESAERLAGSASLAGLEVLRVNTSGGLSEHGMKLLLDSPHVGAAVARGNEREPE